MARVLSSVSQDPPVLRWLHALDAERDVNSDLLRSSICYSCSFPQGHPRPPHVDDTVSSIFIPMYVRAPFILGQSCSPVSTNIMALSVLSHPNLPPQVRSRRFVVDLSSMKPIEFVEYEWLVDGKLCVSLHEVSEDGLYSGQTIIFDGPTKPGSPVPSNVVMRLHYKENPIPGSGKMSLEGDWRDKPNSWETWSELFARFRTGKMSIFTKFAISSKHGFGQRGEFFCKLDEQCAVGETGIANKNSMSNRLIRLFLHKNGMMNAHPATGENITRSAERRMLTDTVTALDDEDSPMFAAPNFELEGTPCNDGINTNENNGTSIFDIADRHTAAHSVDDPEIIEEEANNGNNNHEAQTINHINNNIEDSPEHSQAARDVNGNSASEGPCIPPPQELMGPPEPVYEPSRTMSSFSLPASETNSGSLSLSLPAPGHAKAASSMSLRSTDTAPMGAGNSNHLHLSHLLSADEVLPLASETNNDVPTSDINNNNDKNGAGINGTAFMEIKRAHNNPNSISRTPPNQPFQNLSSNYSSLSPLQQPSAGNAPNGIVPNPALSTKSLTLQPLGTHPLFPLLSPDLNDNSKANANSNVHGEINRPAPSTSLPMRIVPQPIVVPLESSAAVRTRADPAPSSLSRLSLTQTVPSGEAEKHTVPVSIPDAGRSGPVVKSATNGITKPNIGGKSKPSKGHLCALCGSTFSHRGHFNAHMKAVHQKIRNHKCTYPGCEKAFAKRSDLLRHQDSQHAADVRYPCEQCSIIFPTKIELTRHFAQVHDKDRPYKCRVCPKTYSTRSGLRKHLHAKHGNNNNDNPEHRHDTAPSTPISQARNAPVAAPVPIAG